MTAPWRISGSRMRRKDYIYILFGVVLFVLAAATWMYFKPHRSVKAAEPAFTLAASELIDAFVNDEASANMLYGGKILEVKGTVNEILFSDSAMVLLMGNPDQMATVSCYLYNADQSRSASLQPGDSVRIKGICNGMLMDVILDKCILLSEDE